MGWDGVGWDGMRWDGMEREGKESGKYVTNYKDGFTGGRGVRGGGVLFFMIKQKIIRGKMRYSNLSNNMIISEQQLQFKYSNQARLCSSEAS